MCIQLLVDKMSKSYKYIPSTWSILPRKDTHESNSKNKHQDDTSKLSPCKHFITMAFKIII